MTKRLDIDPAIAGFAALALSMGTTATALDALGRTLQRFGPMPPPSPKRAKTRAQRKARKITRRNRK